MIAHLKPYAEYKDSGLPWLGQVPGHWDVRRVKSILREVDRRTRTGTEPLLSLRMQAGLVDHHALGGKRIPASALVGYKRVLPGEIVMNRMRAAAGLFATATSDGLVSPDYAIFQPTHEMSVDYAVQLFRTPMMTSVFRLESRGLGTGESGFLRLYSDRFGMIPVPLPPPAEQLAIVRFLDWSTARLDRAIRAKRKVIALLNEQKQAIIHRAVTRGLDASVSLRPSGVPWLGDIPAHWEVRRLKFVASQIVDCLHATPRYSDSGSYPAIRTADITPGVVHVARAKRISSTDYALWTARLEPRQGDILYSREGERFGIAACVPPDVRLCISQRMMVFRIAEDYSAEFVMRLLNSQSTYGQALQDVIGATAPHVNISTIRNYFLALPARQEQEAIVRHVKSETEPIDTAISRFNREITLLREYRTRLVADVVTGKLDVREAAVGLPEAGEGGEVVDEVEALGEADEDNVGVDMDEEAIE